MFTNVVAFLPCYLKSLACITQVMWAYEKRRHSSGFERHKRFLWSEDLPQKEVFFSLTPKEIIENAEYFIQQ